MGIKNKPVLLLHRKSANRPEVKEAVKATSGIRFMLSLVKQGGK